jgi:hypothetical protein
MVPHTATAFDPLLPRDFAARLPAGPPPASVVARAALSLLALRGDRLRPCRNVVGPLAHTLVRHFDHHGRLVIGRQSGSGTVAVERTCTSLSDLASWRTPALDARALADDARRWIVSCLVGSLRADGAWHPRHMATPDAALDALYGLVRDAAVPLDIDRMAPAHVYAWFKTTPRIQEAVRWIVECALVERLRRPRQRHDAAGARTPISGPYVAALVGLVARCPDMPARHAPTAAVASLIDPASSLSHDGGSDDGTCGCPTACLLRHSGVSCLAWGPERCVGPWNARFVSADLYATAIEGSRRVSRPGAPHGSGGMMQTAEDPPHAMPDLHCCPSSVAYDAGDVPDLSDHPLTADDIWDWFSDGTMHAHRGLPPLYDEKKPIL